MKSFTRALTLLALANYFYALVDILIWQRVFERNKLFEYGLAGYHTGWFAMLCGLIALGTFSLWSFGENKWALWYAVNLYTTATGGLSDILYYWMDGKALPKGLSWGDGAPLWLFKPATDISIMASAVIWIALALASALVLENLEPIVMQIRERIKTSRIEPISVPQSAGNQNTVNFAWHNHADYPFMKE